MNALYMSDSYLKEFKTKVKSVKDKFVVLEETAFYPRGGGQPEDHGIIECGGKEYKVVFVGKFDGNISHEVDSEGLNVGDEVNCKIDWDRRYALMKMHTASHILAKLFLEGANAKITGNQLDVEKSRVDFNVENFDRDIFQKYVDEANELIQKGAEVKVSEMSMKEAKKDDSLFKLAMGFPHDIKTLRIVEIVGIDKQTDGGTHVNNINEIGKITLLECKNKGKGNRRVYFELN